MSSLMFRAAESSDLPALREMYRAVVDRMRADGLDIWDDVPSARWRVISGTARCIYCWTDLLWQRPLHCAGMLMALPPCNGSDKEARCISTGLPYHRSMPGRA